MGVQVNRQCVIGHRGPVDSVHLNGNASAPRERREWRNEDPNDVLHVDDEVVWPVGLSADGGRERARERDRRLELLPKDDPEVAVDLKRVASGKPLSPVLLVRGTPLVVADGYHRICASYHLAEDTDIPCRLVDAP